ncbi:MAG: flagellar biosynthesis protein FlhF [Selenomonadaceae bacterium]|nr:flagellar biosynthesis protein FlhF [Selenomonadaceae bacterium]
MQIKVFRAATMKEAMAEVKAALGDDAVILHTKKLKDGGIFGYGSKDVFEVTAAIEEDKPTQKSQETAVFQSDMPTIQPPKTVLSMYKTSGTQAGIEKAERGNFAIDKTENQINNDKHDFIPIQKEEIPRTSRIIKAKDFESVNSNEGAEVDLEESAKDAPQRKEDAEKIEKLEAELAEMKTLLANFMRKESVDVNLSLQEAMENHDVEKRILDAMAATSGAGETLTDATSIEAKNCLTAFLEKKLKYVSGINLDGRRKECKIVALIGPTGVGKTTTLAKIAAGLVLNRGVKAALITADTYRISAVEQLKTYSDIIGLPLEIVYNQEELRKAIRKHDDKELILIDTAGRSQHNDYQLDELKTLLKANARIEKHLVLSATTKEKDAKDIIDKFSFCNPKCVIFTKVDETSSLGIILNLLYEKDMALSYLANGQGVPDDIVVAGAEALAEIFLRN